MKTRPPAKLLVSLALLAGCDDKPSAKPQEAEGSASPRPAADCKTACEKLIDLGQAELERTIKDMPSQIGSGLAEKARSQRSSDLATCVKGCEGGNLDAACVVAATSFSGAARCARRSKDSAPGTAVSGQAGESGDPASCGKPVDDVPSSTEGAVMALGQYLYWLGGTNGSPSTLARRFDTKTKRWETLPSAGTPRMKAAAGVVDSKLVLAGGMSGLMRNTAAVEVFDVAACAWKLEQPMPWVASGPTGASTPSGLFVSGGEISSGTTLKDFDTESVADAALLTLGAPPKTLPKPATDRAGGAAAFVKGEVYLMGGRRFRKGSDSALGDSTSSVDILTLATSTWREGPKMPAGGEGHAIVLGEQSIVFFAADALGTRAPLIFDIAKQTWSSGKDRSNDLGDVIEGGGVIDGTIYLVAKDIDISSPDKVFVLTYDPKNDSFSRYAP